MFLCTYLLLTPISMYYTREQCILINALHRYHYSMYQVVDAKHVTQLRSKIKRICFIANGMNY